MAQSRQDSAADLPGPAGTTSAPTSGAGAPTVTIACTRRYQIYDPELLRLRWRQIAVRDPATSLGAHTESLRPIDALQRILVEFDADEIARRAVEFGLCIESISTLATDEDGLPICSSGDSHE